MPNEPKQPAHPWLTPGTVGVSAASLCSDAGHEMVTSLLPGFVTGILGGGAAALAAIEGVADALTGLSKLAGGPLAAQPQRRGQLARGGYVVTAAATAAIGLTTAVWQVAILRSVAWVSRGLRSPSRDMLLTDLTDRQSVGRAFGLERMGDNVGAIIGPLLASALVGLLGLRWTILMALIPGVLAALAISVAVREARASLSATADRRRLSLNVKALWQQGLAKVLAPMFCFEMGNLATTLLILRASGILTTPGRPASAAASLAILLYAGHNAIAALMSLAGGVLVDARGPRLVFGLAASSYIVAYAAFAIGGGLTGVIVGFALAGAGIGLAETAESATVALRITQSVRSQAFGLLGLTKAVGDIGATVVAGILWSVISPHVAFAYAGAWMLLALVALQVFLPGRFESAAAPDGDSEERR